jgi:hypothetical protein
MGYEFLRDGYVATYVSGGRELEGFFIDGAADQEARDMMAKFLDALAADGQAIEKVPLGRHVRNRYNQHLFIGQAGPVLYGAMRVPDGLEAAGETLFKALHEAAARLAAGK